MTTTYIFDAETDGLLRQLTKFHCLAIEKYETGEKWFFDERSGNLEEGIHMLQDADVLVGHNILGFDLKAIEKVYPWFETDAKIRDTIILSRLLWADRDKLDIKLIASGILEGKHMGKHGLASWGQRLGYPKGDFSDWCEDRGIDPWGDWGWEGSHTYTDEDGVEQTVLFADVYEYRNEYCRQDVEVTSKLTDHILDTIDRWEAGDFPIFLEHRFEELMLDVQSDGFHLDVPKTELLLEDITKHLDKFHKECAEAFPAAWSPVKLAGSLEFNKEATVLHQKQEKRIQAAEAKGAKTPVTYDYKALLTPMYELLKAEEESPNPTQMGQIKISARSARRTHKFPDGTEHKFMMEAGTCYTPIVFKEFNPNSRQQIVEKLLELGWEPEKYTPAGNPSTEGDILEHAAAEIPVARPIAGGLKCTKIKGYLKSPETKKAKTGWLDIVSKQSKIHARIVHIGAVTHRVSLSRPNIGQIPSVTMKKGDDGVEHVVRGFEGGWGWECRDVFIPPKGWLMMGCDLSGIEVRLFAEEMRKFDGGEYADIVLDGDVHTKNQEAAGLETRAASKTFLYACVPMDTECLTAEGWKKYHELQEGELILTYNSDKGIKEWKPLLEKVKYEDADVVEMSHSHSFSVRSTPNHRWFVRKRRRSGDHRKPYMVPTVETTCQINTESNIIVNAPFVDNRNLPEYDFGRFNDKPKYDTDWVQEVLKMSVPEMKSFLAGFSVADGSYQYGNEKGTNGHWKWSQNFGNIQEAALLASYLVHDGYVNVRSRFDTPTPMKSAHLNNKGHITGQRLVKKNLEKQDVWCVRTENESWVMRQGDVITITGNTLYGIGDLKLGKSLSSGTISDMQAKNIGKAAKNKFFKAIPAARKVIRHYEREAKNGYVTAIDGRRVPCDSGHKALNSRLQNAGALIAKLWTVYFYDAMVDAGYTPGYDGDFVIVAFVHDELQTCCRTREIAEHAGRIAEEQALKAGQFFGIVTPTAAEHKIGNSWAETH